MTDSPISLRQLPNIETERLVLRQTNVSDAAHYLAMSSRILAIPDAARFLMSPRPASIDEAIAKLLQVEYRFIEENSAIPWTITLRGQNELVGIVGFARWAKENFRSEVMYELDPLHWGRGIVTEAVAAILPFGFQAMRLHRVEAHIDPENVRSIQVAERLAFIREGILRENEFYDGRFFDTAIYARLA